MCIMFGNYIRVRSCSQLCINTLPQINSTDESILAERSDEDGFFFDSMSTDDDRYENRSCHYQHSPPVFSPSPGAQKLMQAKDYVESLHQNERAPLLYGKNNVIVQPVSNRSISFL